MHFALVPANWQRTNSLALARRHFDL